MKNKLYTVAFLAITALFVSCTDDDLDGLEPNAKPVATTTVTSLTIVEGRSDVIPFTISNPVNVPSQFKIEVVGGTAEEDTEFTAGNSDTDADTGIPGQGFEITVPAYASSFEIPVNTFRDLDQTEGDETVTLKITAAGVRTVLTPQPYLIEVNIVDYEFCLWSFALNDAYGDGWQGGNILVETDGDLEAYGPEGFGSVIDVPVRKGFSYTFTYISGTTGSGPNTAGAPGYEEENSYVLTSPDGSTTFSDGPVPTTGVITSGTATCN
ncbi:hypothetical protein [Lacinutrix chionoecetis]